MQLRTKLIVDYYFSGFLHAVLTPAAIVSGKILRRTHSFCPCRKIRVVKIPEGGRQPIAYPTFLALKRFPGPKPAWIISERTGDRFSRFSAL